MTNRKSDICRYAGTDRAMNGGALFFCQENEKLFWKIFACKKGLLGLIFSRVHTRGHRTYFLTGCWSERKSVWLFKSFSKVNLLCVIFFVVLIILLYDSFVRVLVLLTLSLDPFYCCVALLLLVEKTAFRLSVFWKCEMSFMLMVLNVGLYCPAFRRCLLVYDFGEIPIHSLPISLLLLLLLKVFCIDLQYVIQFFIQFEKKYEKRFG